MKTARRSASWWALNVAVPGATTTVLAWYVYSRRGQFGSLSEISLAELFFVGMLTAIGFFLNALEFGLLYRLMAAPIGIGENWMLYAAGQAGNYIPGQIGTLYRVRYLKDVHGLAYSTATAAYSVNFVITVFATGVAGLVGCIGLGLLEGVWSVLLVSGLASLVAIACLAAVLPISAKQRSGRIGTAWMRLGNGWQRARAQPLVAVVVLALELVRYGFAAWRLDIVFGWLGTDESFFFFLVIAPIAALATFVAITPAGLGIRELVIASAAVALGRQFDVGLLGSSADRAINMIVVLLTGLPGIVYTTRVMHRVAASRANATGPGSQRPME